MKRRGRSRSPISVQQVRVTLSLRAGEDDDLLAFFATLPPGMRATALKSALRSGQSIIIPPSQEPVDDEEDLGDFLFG